MRLVILESPYAASTPEEIEVNVTYARACVHDSLSRGEAPIASHLLYTQPGVLRDEIPSERQWGIDAGLAWRAVSEASVVYTDRGISRGMEYGIADAVAAGRPVEYRILPGYTVPKKPWTGAVTDGERVYADIEAFCDHWHTLVGDGDAGYNDYPAIVWAARVDGSPDKETPIEVPSVLREELANIECNRDGIHPIYQR